MPRLTEILKKSLDNSTDENKYLRKILTENLEDYVMTLNQIQDVQAIRNITEREKNIKINSIINVKRTNLITKLMELDRTGKSI